MLDGVRNTESDEGFGVLGRMLKDTDMIEFETKVKMQDIRKQTLEIVGLIEQVDKNMEVMLDKEHEKFLASYLQFLERVRNEVETIKANYDIKKLKLTTNSTFDNLQKAFQLLRGESN